MQNPHATQGRGRRSPAFPLIIVLTLVLLALATYWLQLSASHERQRQAAHHEAQVMAEQVAAALSLYTRAQVAGLDLGMQRLAQAWLTNGAQGLATALPDFESWLGTDHLLGLAVIAPDGSSLPLPDTVATLRLEPGLGLALLTQQLARTQPGLQLASPIYDAQEDRWWLPLSYPLLAEAASAGLLLLALRPRYLARGLKDVFPDDANVAVISNRQGDYLARSHDLREVIGRQIPRERDFIVNPTLTQGSYRQVTPIDGVDRHYAWRQVDDYPLVVIAGIGTQHTLGPVDAALTASRRASLAGSAALLLAALLLIAWLWQQRRLQHQAQEHSERLELALRGASLGWWDWNIPQDRLQFNQRWADALGYPLAELPQTGPGYYAWLHPEDRDALREAMNQHLEGRSDRFEAEYRVQHRDGHWLWVLDRGQVMQRDSLGNPLRAAGTLLDISHRKAAEAALTRMATTDPLTGLANRRAFLDELHYQLHLHAASEGPSGVLLLLDIDFFKTINDTHGHAVGDRALQQLAGLMRSVLRQGDFAARLGGEEFAVLLPDVNAEDGLRLAERLRLTIQANPAAELHGSPMTVSIGVTTLAGQDVDLNLQQADQALYAAKRQGRNRVCCWPPEPPAPAAAPS